jgi:hypothetical protein
MKTKLSLLALLLLLAGTGFAQSAPFSARNALYLEAGGTGLILSLNYERLLYQREGFRAGLRVGAMTDPTTFFYEGSYNRAGLPLEAVGLFGQRNHHLEVGMGVTQTVIFDVIKNSSYELGELVIERGNEYFATVLGRLGYRYQRPAGGVAVPGRSHPHAL